MVVLPRLGIEPNPDFPKNSPPRPSPIPTPALTPSPTPSDIIASITSSATSPPPKSTSSSSTDNGAGFMQVAEDGTSGDKLLRGFLVGMAIGILVSLVMCCWLPCLRRARRTRLQRRNDNIRRRRLVVLEDEAWVSENWPRRRPWEVGDDESGSHESHEG
ncbi:hypothetical protein A9Z42_0020110 [Trichoderma parareesei]|uniref:Uncharacterized protein n=1 Tax=Trichoderma parareesei TaxID=858221 RepID=A0A2H2Z5H9_TRIPA|nr:hypothetical protein A9Z42_0020110 [Trichoderma parareesei]